VKLIKKYIALTKPGIIRGNVMTTAAGFLLAADGHINWTTLIATVLGTSFVIGSACTFNNYIDRDIDKKMARTKKRALVTGEISTVAALTFAALLGTIGFAELAIFTNWLTVALGVTAYIFYIAIYAVAKRRTTYGTIVGSVAGALPITAGYTAASNRLDNGAALLFLSMTFWQMPHFYAIAIRRLKDYKAAGLPVLPAVKGVHRTKLSMLGYIVAYAITTSLLTTTGHTGYLYIFVMLTLSLTWLNLAIRGFNTGDDVKWAGKLFGFSLIVLLGFSVMIAVNAWIP